MGRLSATSETPQVDAYIIAVPTPFNGDHTADLSYVQAATEQIAAKLRPGAIVILESTSPPGTTEKVRHWIGALRPDLRMPYESEPQADTSSPTALNACSRADHDRDDHETTASSAD